MPNPVEAPKSFEQGLEGRSALGDLPQEVAFFRELLSGAQKN